MVDAGVGVVLEEDPLAALLLVHPRIVRQVVGRRLVAVAQVPGAKRRVHDFHRRHQAVLRRPILGRERQRVLEVGHPFLEDLELLALGFVAHHHCGAPRRLHAQEVVEIGLVGREDDVELRVLQIEPRQIALEVVVGEQRRGAQGEELLEQRVIGELGGGAEVGRGALEKRLVDHVVGRRDERLVRSASDHGVLVVERCLLVRMRRHVGVELGAREVFREECAPRRHRLVADERLVLVEQVEARALDPEHAPHFLTEQLVGARPRAPAFGGERLPEREAIGVALEPVHLLDLAARRDQLVEHLALALGERRGVEGHRHRLPLGEPAVEVGHDAWQRRGADEREGRGEQEGKARESARGHEHGASLRRLPGRMPARGPNHAARRLRARLLMARAK